MAGFYICECCNKGMKDVDPNEFGLVLQKSKGDKTATLLFKYPPKDHHDENNPNWVTKVIKEFGYWLWIREDEPV